MSRPWGPILKTSTISIRRSLTGLAAIAMVAGLATACVPAASSGGHWATAYRSLVPYTGLGGTAEEIGNGRVSHVAVGSLPAGAYPVRDAAGMIIGVTSGCVSGRIGTSGTMSLCFDGATPGSDFLLGTGGTLVVTSQASAGAPVIVDTTSEPAPVPTSGLSSYLFQTYVHTTCATNAPSFPTGDCYGVSITLQFGSSPISI